MWVTSHNSVWQRHLAADHPSVLSIEPGSSPALGNKKAGRGGDFAAAGQETNRRSCSVLIVPSDFKVETSVTRFLRVFVCRSEGGSACPWPPVSTSHFSEVYQLSSVDAPLQGTQTDSGKKNLQSTGQFRPQRAPTAETMALQTS